MNQEELEICECNNADHDNLSESCPLNDLIEVEKKCGCIILMPPKPRTGGALLKGYGQVVSRCSEHECNNEDCDNPTEGEACCEACNHSEENGDNEPDFEAAHAPNAGRGA